MKKIKSNKGFTLVETLIAILLLSIVLVGGMTLFINADAIVQMAIHKKIAIEIATGKLEELKMKKYNDVVSEPSSTMKVGGLDAQQMVTVTEIDADNPPNGQPDYKQVVLDLTWAEAEKTSLSKLELTTFISP